MAFRPVGSSIKIKKEYETYCIFPFKCFPLAFFRLCRGTREEVRETQISQGIHRAFQQGFFKILQSERGKKK
ncbi:MAG: hypothetical protein IKZ00_06075, partial [Bacteroidaceae bacterium]|nr:hypothetical protein [Bacteroidaceae bacterium]